MENLLTPPTEISKCPSCRSIYIEDDQCESCGVQFNFRKVGDPLGRKSFYALVEQHRNEHSEILEPFFPQHKQELVKKLLFRFRTLVDYFLSGGDEDYKKFLVELDHLAQYLLDRGLDGEQLLKIIPQESLIYQRVGRRCYWLARRPKLAERILNWRLSGTYKVSHLLLFLSLISLGVVASLAYFRYYFASL